MSSAYMSSDNHSTFNRVNVLLSEIIFGVQSSFIAFKETTSCVIP